MVDCKITNRLKRMIHLAEQVVAKEEKPVIYPVHLFMGALQEGTGVLGELRVNNVCLLGELKKIAQNLPAESKSFKVQAFNNPISKGCYEVLKKSLEIMKGNKQTVLTEGHVIRALMELDNEVTCHLTVEQIQHILLIAAACRDLAVPLKTYKFSLKQIDKRVKIRQAVQSDYEQVYDFISHQFAARWAIGLRKLFEKEKVSVFLAFREEKLIGFAAYNQVGIGILGPMGVSMEERGKHIGYNLLQYTLEDMKQKGYNRIIINDAGPIEFYENSCGAEPIYE